eukprot:372331-Rhodomonas_salina.3
MHLTPVQVSSAIYLRASYAMSGADRALSGTRGHNLLGKCIQTCRPELVEQVSSCGTATELQSGTDSGEDQMHSPRNV